MTLTSGDVYKLPGQPTGPSGEALPAGVVASLVSRNLSGWDGAVGCEWLKRCTTAGKGLAGLIVCVGPCCTCPN